jgi:IS5 family transposase
VRLERMLRIHCLQHWVSLSDPAVEEALHDSRPMRESVGIDLGREPVSDETTIRKLRYLLEAHERGPQILAAVNAHLAGQGFKVSTGTIVDATIMSAPSSTKNRDGERDPEMRQTKKGNELQFGMKAHIDVDSRHKPMHSVVVTAVNVHVSHLLPELLRGNERAVWGDSAYQVKSEVIHALAPQARDKTHSRYRRGGWLDPVERRKSRYKSCVRAKIEHPFLVLKAIFSFRTVRYRGLAKKAQRLMVACGLVNLLMLRQPLLGLA